MSARRVIWVFVDGVGLGPADSANNPLADPDRESFFQLAAGQLWTNEVDPVTSAMHVFRPIEATLGLPGLPQSGTGQASLFTGVNCAARAGRHWGPFPHSTSLPVIRESSLFARLADRGLSGQFVNAFPNRFFQAATARKRWTVTTRCCIEADIPLKTESDLRRGRALAADLTARTWRSQLNLDVPILTPKEAGRQLAELGSEADVTLFEYFLTDKAGHARDRDLARGFLDDLDAFFRGCLEEIDLSSTLLIVTSDHGNVEDLSVRVHTRNPVPLAVLGTGANAFIEATSITDVTPAILQALTN